MFLRVKNFCTPTVMTLHTSLSLPIEFIYELRDSWIADTGSDTHVCNDLSRFYMLNKPQNESILHFIQTAIALKAI